MRRLLLAAALLAGATSVQAVEVAQLDCAVERLAPETRTRLSVVVADLASQEDPAVRAFDDALAQCRAQYSWTEEQWQTARRGGLAMQGLVELRRRFAADGVDLTRIEQALLTDPQLLSVMRARTFQEEDMHGIAMRHLPLIQASLGSRGNDAVMLNRIGVFVGVRVVLEDARYRFGQR